MHVTPVLRPRLFPRLLACAAALTVSSPAWLTRADIGPQDMPGTGASNNGPATPAGGEDDFLVEVTGANNQLPVLVITAANESDRPVADEVRRVIELTGLFATPSLSITLTSGAPDRAKWPGGAVAVVVVGRSTPPSPGFPVVTASTYHRSMPDEIRRRNLTEFPGASSLTAPTLADAIVEDVVGTRANMSGQIVYTDASTRGERAVRIIGPDSHRGRRISGFGGLARGADFGEGGLVSYAAEDASGKLGLFREGQAAPLPLRPKGYLQSIAYAPSAKFVAVSMGLGNTVETWSGPSLDRLAKIDLEPDKSSLSPSISDEGELLHATGPHKGPFTIMLGNRAVSAAGTWAAMPSFCSTSIEKRVVYMVKAGRSWSIRVTSLTNGASRTVASNAMSPACSPDGKTVAFYSPGKGGKGPGLYLTSDQGGKPHKIWEGQAAGMRWRAGEALPPRQIERLAPPAPAPQTAAQPVDKQATSDTIEID